MGAAFKIGLAAFVFFIAAGFGWSLKETGRPPGLKTQALEEADRAYHARNYARAAKRYRGYLSLYPYDFKAINRLGESYLRQRRWKDSAAAYERYLQFNPDRGRVLARLSFVYYNLSRKQKSRDAGFHSFRRARYYASMARRSGEQIPPGLLGRLGLLPAKAR